MLKRIILAVGVFAALAFGQTDRTTVGWQQVTTDKTTGGNCMLYSIMFFNPITGHVQGCVNTTPTTTGTGIWTILNAASGGSVTSFAAASANWPTWLVPSVTNSTTTPSLSVAASNIPVTALNSGTGATSTTYWRGDGTWGTPPPGTVTSFTASTGWPSWLTPTVTSATSTPTLTVAASNIPVTALNSGTSATSTTFWRGDGTWSVPAYSGGTVTNFTAASGSWPTWMVPTVSNAASTPTLTVAAGNIPVTALNSGTSASSTTYWRGDGTWATPTGGTGLTAAPPYSTDGTNFYDPADQMFVVTKPSLPTSILNSTATTLSVLGTNGNYLLNVAAGVVAYGVYSGFSTSIEMSFTNSQIPAGSTGQTGTWVYDSTNSAIQGCSVNTGGGYNTIAGAAAYTGTGAPPNPVLTTALTNTSSVKYHIKMTLTGTSLQCSFTFDGGQHYTNFGSAKTVGTIASSGIFDFYALSNITSVKIQ